MSPGRRHASLRDRSLSPSINTPAINRILISSSSYPMKPAFCHLRIHSEYSIVDGLVRLDDLIPAVASDGQPAVALTDLSNLFGMIKFYKSTRSKGVKPIIGCEVFVSNEETKNTPSRILLLAKNRTGYLQICELISRAWLTNQHKGQAHVQIDWLRKLSADGSEPSLIALSGASLGDIGLSIKAGDVDTAISRAKAWNEIFPGHFYIEVQRRGQPEDDSLVKTSAEIAYSLGIPLVATHPIQFMRKEEFRAHEARVCIAEGELLSNQNRRRLFTEEQCFKTQEEMRELFADMPQALENTVLIAKRCNVTIELNKAKLPDFPVPAGMTIDDFLRHEAERGLDSRLAHLYPDPALREQERKRYETRLKFELDTICRMKFPGYFLIVAEFIKWAKENGVPVGPGRGSGAGSLVAYSLLITDLDPLAYNLLFERFLNPDRVSMPDFDIDFCQEGRDRVIQHVKDLYGKDAVSQIATFGTMAAKGAIRDVGRVLDLGYSFCDGISKLIPFKPGKHVTIAGAIEEEPQLADRLRNEEEVSQLLSLAQQVEGITRNIGMHAGGVLIAPGKLTDFCPLYTQGGDSGVVSQFDKDDVESVGLVKFDFLGLTTLTILDRAVRYIRAMHPEMSEFKLETLPMDDEPSYTLLSSARTVAVFQLESRGMQGMLKEAKPDRFEDIIALVALYRPGPMDLIPDFCRRKHGEAFGYPDPRTEGILAETYGIMVYQEQVMQMAQVVGGYTLGGADLLRRAMGKKKVEEMAQHRQLFRDGAAKGGLTSEKADEIFDLMEKFAGYGFNKSHAAAYALLSYHTAYLKAHYPAEFMAANLSLAMDDTDKIKILHDDAVDVCGLKFLPPCINESDCHFLPKRSPDGTVTMIRYGLGAIKGAGQSAIAGIISARGDTPFRDLFDFTQRVDKHFLNKRTLESLVRAGALDCFGVDRASLLASVPLAIESAQKAKSSAMQVGLFDDFEEASASPQYVICEPWSFARALAEEKSVVGFFLSGHPYSAYQKEATRFAKTKLADVRSSRESAVFAGIICGIKTQTTARGKMCTVSIDDGSAVVDVTVYSEVFDANRKVLIEDQFVAVLGKASTDRFSGGMRITAEKIWNIHSARNLFASSICFDVSDQVDPSIIAPTLVPFRSKNGLRLRIERRCGNARYVVAFPEQWSLEASEDLNTALTTGLGASRVEFIY
jgi:DNA polymerase-3 subunit alpha